MGRRALRWLNSGIVYADHHASTAARVSGVSTRVDVRAFPAPVSDRIVVGASQSILDRPKPRTVQIWLLREEFTRNMSSPVYSHQPPRWGFPFHAVCFSVLTRVFGFKERYVQCLFNVLRSFPANMGILSWNHDYCGLYRMPYTPLRLPPYEAGALFVGFIASTRGPHGYPYEGADIRTLGAVGTFLRAPAPGALPPAWPKLFRTTNFWGEGRLGRLPDEIISEILHLLSTRDVCNLRLASRRAANLPMPDSFFYSRFMKGREMDHIWEATHYKKKFRGMWQTIYRAARANSRDPEIYNRRRVWDLAQKVFYLLHRNCTSFLAGHVSDRFEAVVDVKRGNHHKETVSVDGADKGGDDEGIPRLVGVIDERVNGVVKHGELAC